MAVAMAREHNMLMRALAYAARGIPVFPLLSRQKEPATSNGFYAATTDPAQIRRWFARTSHNIGMPTGEKSGRFHIDIDPRHGGTLDSLQERGSLPETQMICTGGGGYQLAFLMPDGVDIRNHTNILPGIDVRGTGGYVVLPPSIHPSGNRYELLNDLEPVPAPEWLIRLVMTPERPKTGYTAPVDVPEDQDAEARYWLERYLADTYDGNRNNTGFLLAAQLRDTARLTEMEAEPYMLEYAARVPGDDYTEKDALKTLRSAYKQPAREPARRKLTIVPDPEPEITVDAVPPEPAPEPAQDATIEELRRAIEELRRENEQLKRENWNLRLTVAKRDQERKWEDDLFSSRAMPQTAKLIAREVVPMMRRAIERGETSAKVYMEGIAEKAGISKASAGSNMQVLSKLAGLNYRTETRRDENGQIVTKSYIDVSPESPLLTSPAMLQPEKPRNHGGQRVKCRSCGEESVIEQKVTHTYHMCTNPNCPEAGVRREVSEHVGDLKPAMTDGDQSEDVTGSNLGTRWDESTEADPETPPVQETCPYEGGAEYVQETCTGDDSPEPPVQILEPGIDPSRFGRPCVKCRAPLVLRLDGKGYEPHECSGAIAG